MPGDLAGRTLELVDIASESRAEATLAAHVLELLPDARDAGDTCVLAGVTERGERPLVLLAGHLDTVPAQGNRPGRRDEEAVHGLGASDMKAGVAVMIETALADAGARSVDLGFVFFGREELPAAESALTPLLAREPGLRTADLVIVMEPTANAIQAGCLGNISATWSFSGVAGHSARPWLADNAIHRAARGIAEIAEIPVEDHVYEGLTFREAVSVTRVAGGIADNVVPDHAEAMVNYRYAPGRSPADAEARVRGWCEPHGTIEILSNAPSGRVPEGNALLQRLREAGDLAVEPKQAWTPVAEFSLAGVDAVNFGPGDPAFAHRRDEQVTVAALERCFAVLERFACA
ncbi:MAG: succinyl-diaminopimelate desuccinylase [Solirubrobacteraceae bacterium]|nr:succinyl-diaminopimelate desuccinylase [Solirubrobacteraceae bacterium]